MQRQVQVREIGLVANIDPQLPQYRCRIGARAETIAQSEKAYTA